MAVFVLKFPKGITHKPFQLFELLNWRNSKKSFVTVGVIFTQEKFNNIGVGLVSTVYGCYNEAEPNYATFLVSTTLLVPNFTNGFTMIFKRCSS